MRTHSLALALLALLAAPAVALDVVELKNGRLYQVDSAKVQGGRFFMQLHVPKGDKKVGFAVPIDQVVPEFVYYVWADQIAVDDADGRVALAEWARKNGLFTHAMNQYQEAAKLDPAVHSRLPEIEKVVYQEQATWIFEDAERHFRDGDVKRSRLRIELILKKFDQSKEVGRAKALLAILAEREQFLTEQKRQEAIAGRARKQKRRIDKYVEFVGKADSLVLKTRLNYHPNAKSRLHWAAYAYRKAFFVFDEMTLVAEVDELRHMLKSLIASMQERMARTFLKLADLNWISGDPAGALDAVHEVLGVEPGNKAALGLRDRILDGGAAPTAAEPRILDPVYHSPRYGHDPLLVYEKPRPYAYATPYVRGFGVSSIRYVTVRSLGHRGTRRSTIKIPYYPRYFYR